MLDSNWLITAHDHKCPYKHLFTEANLGELYALLATWDQYDAQVNATISADDPFCGVTLTAEDLCSTMMIFMHN
jgi:hypothetical protein